MCLCLHRLQVVCLPVCSWYLLTMWMSDSSIVYIVAPCSKVSLCLSKWDNVWHQALYSTYTCVPGFSLLPLQPRVTLLMLITLLCVSVSNTLTTFSPYVSRLKIANLQDLTMCHGTFCTRSRLLLLLVPEVYFYADTFVCILYSRTFTLLRNRVHCLLLK